MARHGLKRLSFLLVAAALAVFLHVVPLHPASALPSAVSVDNRTADLIVYGGTASGVMTAYSAAREGLHVILLEPGTHLGGMVAGGLSATDLGHFTIIGGYAKDFYMQAAAHYGLQNLDEAANWRSEPHVDADVFRAMLADAGVTVYFHERLREHRGVRLYRKTIRSLTTEDGKQ